MAMLLVVSLANAHQILDSWPAPSDSINGIAFGGAYIWAVTSSGTIYQMDYEGVVTDSWIPESPGSIVAWKGLCYDSGSLYVVIAGGSGIEAVKEVGFYPTSGFYYMLSAELPGPDWDCWGVVNDARWAGFELGQPDPMFKVWGITQCYEPGFTTAYGVACLQGMNLCAVATEPFGPENTIIEVLHTSWGTPVAHYRVTTQTIPSARGLAGVSDWTFWVHSPEDNMFYKLQLEDMALEQSTWGAIKALW